MNVDSRGGSSADQAQGDSPAAMDTFNYFNYFTEIEEYFWRKRGAHLLVSPLDWAILETWQKADIPVAAVLKGIDRAFESYQRSRRGQAGRQLKSLAYCVEAVLEAAEEMKEAAAGTGPSAVASRPANEQFSRDELKRFFTRNVERLSKSAAKLAEEQPDLALRVRETGEKLAALLPLLESSTELDLEDLERRLTILEEKLSASLSSLASESLLLDIRRELDRQLAPYRRKMTAAQLSDLERRYTQKRLFESHGLPRLSLFYLN
jgi:hypothetical protein